MSLSAAPPRIGGMLETAEAPVSPASYSSKVQRQDRTEPGALQKIKLADQLGEYMKDVCYKPGRKR